MAGSLMMKFWISAVWLVKAEHKVKCKHSISELGLLDGKKEKKRIG